MDYLEIVLQGFFNKSSRKHLPDYFLQKFKKAKKDEFFEADVFFSGLTSIIEYWENDIQRRVSKRKDMILDTIFHAKNGTLKYDNKDMEGKTIEQKNRETIEDCKQELKYIRPDGIGRASYRIHLSDYKQGFNYSMAYDEILEIKKAITTAQWGIGYKKISRQPEKSKQIQFKDFFNGLDESKINEIQREIKDAEGIRLAFLINVLNFKNKIKIIVSSKKFNRINFVRALKNDDTIKNIEAVNKYIRGVTAKAKLEKDPVYSKIKEQIDSII